VRTLPEQPSLDQLRRQARELLAAWHARQPDAVAEVNQHYRDADPTAFALHDAQLVLARAYGFANWPRLKAFVDGANVSRLVEVVRSGDVRQAEALLRMRPELARMSAGNMQPIHFAVLNRSPELVRLLMEHGANPWEGVYPHREATTAYAMAADRGYDEIVAIIESRPQPVDVFRPIVAGKHEEAIARFRADPALIHCEHPVYGWTPLHVAAKVLNVAVLRWLLEHGADPNRVAARGLTPLDIAASWSGEDGSLEPVADLLLRHGAELTARAAAALGRTDFAYTVNPVDDRGGLLRIAVSHSRSAVLERLLDLGFDPNENVRLSDDDDGPLTCGMPLWECASTGKHQLAALLLERGADANADVYAAGTPLHRAFERGDERMIELLLRYGGRVDETIAGIYGHTETAHRLLAAGGDARQLVWAAACGGHEDIVTMALAAIDWPRGDPRWFSMIEQTIRMKYPGRAYHRCLALLLQRCDPNLRGRPEDGGRFGLTLLHSLAGARSHITAQQRVEFAVMLIDAGARLDVRDNLLRSTPLGWACRHRQYELARLFLDRGADPVEHGAEPWATPEAWCRRVGADEIVKLIRR
jgi:ankyrin repeat protein